MLKINSEEMLRKAKSYWFSKEKLIDLDEFEQSLKGFLLSQYLPVFLCE